MPLYSRDSTERVREAVDIVDLISARTDLKRAGVNRFLGLCPFHSERTSSFSVDPSQKVYYCFGCQAAGDVFTFVMSTEGVDFPGALELLADRYGITLEQEREDPQAVKKRERLSRLYQLLDRVTSYYSRYLWESDEAERARDYLAQRGLEQRTLQSFRVGYAPSAWDRILTASRRAGFSEQELYAAGLSQRSTAERRLYDRFRGRIVFPLADLRGRVIGFGARGMGEQRGPKYLNTPEGELYHKGRQLFGAPQARAQAAKAGAVILSEGYTDVIALHQAGFTNSVGLMGTALTTEQVGELGRLAPKVLLALDADSAGQAAMLRAARLVTARRLELFVVELPRGMDPAELIQRQGAPAFQALVEGALSLANFEVQQLLASANLQQATERDRVLEELRDVFGAMRGGVQREELMRLAASKLEISEQLVASLAQPRAPRAMRTDRDGQRSSPSPTAVNVAFGRRTQTERTLLALCLALPTAGAEALARLDFAEHFTETLTRRAADYLVGRLAAPTAGLHLASSDRELNALVAELVVRSKQLQATEAMLEVECLQLELARIERQIAKAQTVSDPALDQLAVERNRLQQQLRGALDRSMVEHSASTE